MKNPQFLRLLILTTALAAVRPAATVAGEWTGNGPSVNWSDANNWDPATTPTSASYLFFSDVFYQTAYTNAVGLVNNIVDTSYTAGGVNFNTLSGSTAGNHHYTTLIPAGITLTVDGGTPGPIGEQAFLVGNYFQTSGSLTNYTTITGEGSLAVNNPASVISVRQVSRATLDLSGLNTFTANVASFLTGVPQFDSTATFVGNVLLAKTNTITTSAGLNAPGVLLGSANTGTGTAFLGLGKVNAFNTDAMVVGGLRAGFGTALFFGPGNSNSVPVSTFTLRGSAGGAAPIPVFTVGDLSANYDSFTTNRTGGSSTSSADFSGGSVDILADKIYIGRSANNEVGVSTSASTGNLIVEQGSVTATNVYIAHKVTATNSTAGQGTLILRSNALMTVYNDLSLCFRTNGTAFINASGLQVRDAAVLNVGGNITTTQTGSGTPAAISLAGGTINLTSGGSVFTPTLNGFGTIAGASSVTVTNSFSVNNDSAVGTLTLGNNLTLANPFGLTFNLGAGNTVGGGVNDYLSVANNISFNNNPLALTYSAPLVVGSYTLISYGGTQSGSVSWSNPTRSAISLVQGSGQVALNVASLSPATLTWRGTGASAQWGAPVNSTTAAATNWNANTERFLTFDHVVFDDTGIAPTVTITNVVVPSSIIVNNSSVAYTISQSGSGRISGFTGLTKNGTGTLTLGGSTVNDFTGPVTINAGMIKVGSFNAALFGTNSTSTITISSGGTLDMNGNNSLGTAGTHGHILNLAGAGAGGVGAITKSAGTGQSTLTTSGVTLSGDTTLSCTAGSRLILSGTFASYNSVFDLAGHTLTTSGIEVRLSQMTLTNTGNITVGSTSLSLQNCVVSGPGTIDLGNSGLYLNSYTAGYINKAISINSGFISTVSATATPLLIGSAITINDSLNYTNLQPTRLTNVISGAGSLTKYGNTNLTLEAANTFTGPATVAAGRLTLAGTGSLASALVQVNAELDVAAHGTGYNLINGQNLSLGPVGTVLGSVNAVAGSTLSGFGGTAGNVVVANGGTIAPGGILVAGTLTVTNNLTFNGGTNVFKLGSETTPGAGVNDLVVVGGDLTFTAPTTVRIQPVGSMSAQPYTLWQYTGTLTGIENVSVTSSLRPGTTYTLDTNTPGVVQLVIVSASANLVWAGGAPGNPTTWDVGSTLNWIKGGLADLFYQGDQVTFDNTAVVNLATISSQTQPAAMTNNATGTMVLNGSGNLLAGNLVANSGNFIIANTNNNLFNGSGIILNGGNVSFDQPGNATVTSKFSGDSGFLIKDGTNTLTLVSTDSTNLHAGIAVQAGTLRPVGVNALGTDHVTMQSPATLDINGQMLMTNIGFHIQGHGADGQGAINNRGAAQTNAISALVIHADSTIGAASNRWDVSGTVFGNSNSLTKLGAADIVLRTATDTGLGDINVNAGRLIFAGAGNDLGDTAKGITIAPGATNGFAQNIAAGPKPMNILSNGTLAGVYFGSATVNTFAGAITLNTNAGAVMVDNLVELGLTGDITGTGTLIAGSRGNLALAGTNNYRGGTLVRLGQLTLEGTGALPTNSPVILTNVGVPSSDTTFISLRNGAKTPADAPLTMYSSRSGSGTLSCTIGGDGTWAGPLAIRTAQIGTANNPQVGISGGANEGITIVGAVNGTTNYGDLNITGLKHFFNGPVLFGGSINIGNNGLADATGVTMTRATFNNQNSWTNTFIPRALITLGTNNALPTNAPILVGTLTAGTVIHLIGFDLNGYDQTLSSLTERAATTAFHNDSVWFYNSSTESDSILTYAGTGTNTWSAALVDHYDSVNPAPHKLGLKVSSGRLILEFVADRTNAVNYRPDFATTTMVNSYTGPTLVSGGALIVNSELGLTPITVNGTGLFGGTGVISGPITIATGGTLAPGRSVGTLTATSNLVLQAGSKCEIEVNLGTGAYDQVTGLNEVSYGGTLVITNIGSQPFTNGTVLQLFSAASYVSGAVTIQPASPGANLIWDTSGLAVDGKLKVIAAPLPSGVTVLPDGNVSFTLTGIPGQPYTVLTSTNVALPLPDWTVLATGIMPGSTLNFTDLNATNYPVRFYRTSAP